MELSFCTEVTLTCSHCRNDFHASVWLIVDIGSRPDLYEAIRTETLHDYTCPHCRQQDHYGDNPLLLYRPGKTPTLLFSPAQSMARKDDEVQVEDEMHMNILLMMLRERLGSAWQNSWLDKLTLVGRDLLPSCIDLEEEDVPSEEDVEMEEDSNIAMLTALAAQTMSSYKNTNDEVALEQAVILWQQVLQDSTLSQIPASAQWNIFNAAGTAFYYRYQTYDHLHDLDQAIRLWNEACMHASDPIILSRNHILLGEAFDAHYRLTKNIQDLEHAITHYRIAVTLAPPDLVQLPRCLHKLGNDLFSLNKLVGQQKHLEEAIASFREAVERSASNSPDLPIYLTSWANGLSDLFDLKEDLRDLEEAIKHHREGLNLLPPHSPNAPLLNANLGTVLARLSTFTMDPQILDEAISHFQKAVNDTPTDSLHYPDYLVNLSLALSKHYEFHGQLSDLEQACDYAHAAVKSTQSDSSDLSSTLCNLGIRLHDLFAHTGKEEHLEKAIHELRRAVDSTPQLHLAQYLNHLNALAGAILDRFRLKGQVVYLEDAMALQREALQHISPDMPVLRRILQYNLSITLALRHEQLKVFSDIEEAIQLLQENLQSAPQIHWSCLERIIVWEMPYAVGISSMATGKNWKTWTKLFSSYAKQHKCSPLVGWNSEGPAMTWAMPCAIVTPIRQDWKT